MMRVTSPEGGFLTENAGKVLTILLDRHRDGRVVIGVTQLAEMTGLSVLETWLGVSVLHGNGPLRDARWVTGVRGRGAVLLLTLAPGFIRTTEGDDHV